MTHTRQVPVVLTLVDQDDIDNLRAGGKWTDVLKRALVRAAHEAYGPRGCHQLYRPQRLVPPQQQPRR